MKYLFQRLGARSLCRVKRLYAQIERDEGSALRAELNEMVAGFG